MARQRLTYPTDVTDEAWQLLAPLLPPETSDGRPRNYPRREVLKGIHDILRGGCAWRLMPHALPPGQTAYQSCRAWRPEGTWRKLHDQLRAQVRTRLGRHPQPSAAMIEAQPVKTTEQGGAMAMTARSNATAASASSSWTRRVSCGESSSMPPTGGRPPWRRGGSLLPRRSSAGCSTAGRTWLSGGSRGARGWKPRAAGPSRASNAHGAGAGLPWRSSRRPCGPSRCWRAGGWWHGRSPGSVGTAA